MENQIIQGKQLQLQLLIDNEMRTIAYATSHTLSVQARTHEVLVRAMNGYPIVRVDDFTWQLSADHLFTQEEADILQDCLVNRTLLEVKFSLTGEESEHGYTGRCYIQSLDINAQHGALASFAISLLGSGALRRISDSDTLPDYIPVATPTSLQFQTQSGTAQQTTSGEYQLPELDNPTGRPVRIIVYPLIGRVIGRIGTPPTNLP